MPWHVAITFFRAKGKPVICSGTIICPNFVMGSWHCNIIKGQSLFDRPRVLEVVIGAHAFPLERTAIRRRVKKIHKYRRPWNNRARFSFIPVKTST